jgi:hypothetical protein
MAAARHDRSDSPLKRHTPEFLLAFTIGALVGIGLAVTWVPEHKRRRTSAARIGERYRRMRAASAAAIEDMRETARKAASDFREELGAGLEAAREEFGDMARQQLTGTRKALRREIKKLRR